MPSDAREGAFLLLGHFLRLGLLAGGGHDLQADHAGLHGAIDQRVPAPLHGVPDHLGDLGFPRSEALEPPDRDGLSTHERPQLGQHPRVEHVPHLHRHAGQREQQFPVLLCPDAGGRPYFVLNGVRPLGNAGLNGIPGGHLDPPELEELLHLLQQVRVKHQLHAQELGESLSGQVVIGRSQSAGSHHHIRFAGRQGQRTHDRIYFIGYAMHADDRQTDGPQPPGDVRGVRVDGLPVQQLVADAEDAGLLDVFITHGNRVLTCRSWL